MGLQQQGKTRVGFFLARNRMPFSLFPLNEWRPAPPEIGTSGQLHMVRVERSIEVSARCYLGNSKTRGQVNCCAKAILIYAGNIGKPPE